MSTWMERGISCDRDQGKKRADDQVRHLMGQWDAEREAVVEGARAMLAKRLVVGSAGNVSMRIPGKPMLAITPSRKAYSDLGAEDIQIIDFEAGPVDGDAIPSVESLVHIGIYRARQDVGAVVHTHSTYASALAVAHRSLPPVIDEMVTSLGGEIRVTSYAFPSTEELAERVTAGISNRNAVLLANHGVVGVGNDPRGALSVCELVERASKIYIFANLLGGAHKLPKEVVDTEMELFKMMRDAAEGGGSP